MSGTSVHSFLHAAKKLFQPVFVFFFSYFCTILSSSSTIPSSSSTTPTIPSSSSTTPTIPSSSSTTHTYPSLTPPPPPSFSHSTTTSILLSLTPPPPLLPPLPTPFTTFYLCHPSYMPSICLPLSPIQQHRQYVSTSQLSFYFHPKIPFTTSTQPLPPSPPPPNHPFLHNFHPTTPSFTTSTQPPPSSPPPPNPLSLTTSTQQPSFHQTFTNNPPISLKQLFPPLLPPLQSP